jgi:hypothetical protein
MFATDLTMKQKISEARFRDFLREAERERNAAIAVANRPAKRRRNLDSARASAASALLRAGHRLMPTDAREDSSSLGAAGLELRPGQ